MVPDAELLRRYETLRDEAAFSELVQRYLGLVHASALRRTHGRDHLAREIAQSVFTDLARKVSTVRHHPALPAWLYRSTRYAAITALREETRRLKLAHAAAIMPPASDDEPPADWSNLRPLIDAAMDRLRESDRTVLLLRFFEGLTFAEVGSRLNVAENTARMRAERALEKLRRHLQGRGLSSSATALGLVLSHSAVASAPPGLAAVVTSAALSTASTSTGAGLAAVLLMSKFTAPVVSAIAASATTLLLWTSVAPHTTAHELTVLREENAQLRQALAPDGSPQALAAVARNVDSTIFNAVRAVEQRSVRHPPGHLVSTTANDRGRDLSQPRADASRHRNRGQAKPEEAALSFAWASESGEIAALSQLLWFDPEVRRQAEAVLATMPDSLRQNYATPEQLFALIFAADAIIAPPPGPDLLEQWTPVELSAGRVAMRAPGSKPSIDYHQYQQTPDGWKYVVPDVAVRNMPAVLMNETLAKFAQP